MALELTHLVTNGCSFTYGQALYDPPNEAWPKLLADKLGVPIVNLAVGGSGNDSIHRRTYEYFYKNLNTNSKPFYVIAMSMNTRREEYVINYNGSKLNEYVGLVSDESTNINPLSRAVYENMDDLGINLSEVKKLHYWASIINLFKAHNIPYLTSDYFPDPTKEVVNYINTHHYELKSYIDTDTNRLENFNYITYGYPKALDNAHCGKEAQVALADYIHKQLISRYGEVIPVTGNFISLKDKPTSPYKNSALNAWYRKEIGLKYKYGLDG